MKVFRLLLSVILAMAGGFHMTWAGEIHGTSAGRNWNCFSCCTRTGQLVDSTAGRARAWKACGLRPFPCKARGLRFAHRRKGGKGRPLSACPQPFHGAPGRTGPAGLPTPFPHPRAAPGDRCAFSTRPTADDHQQLSDQLRRAGRGPPAAARPSLRKSLLERTYRKDWTQLRNCARVKKCSFRRAVLNMS